MKQLEEQLSEVIAESDRVAAELHRELFLIGRAHAAIGYLRSVREESARRVEVLLEQRAQSLIAPPPRPREAASMTQRPATPGAVQQAPQPQAGAYGTYDPNWPQP